MVGVAGEPMESKERQLGFSEYEPSMSGVW